MKKAEEKGLLKKPAVLKEAQCWAAEKGSPSLCCESAPEIKCQQQLHLFLSFACPTNINWLSHNDQLIAKYFGRIREEIAPFSSLPAGAWTLSNYGRIQAMSSGLSCPGLSWWGVSTLHIKLQYLFCNTREGLNRIVMPGCSVLLMAWLHGCACRHRDESTFGTSLVCAHKCHASVMCNSFENQYFESSLHPINLCLRHGQAKPSLSAFN